MPNLDLPNNHRHPEPPMPLRLPRTASRLHVHARRARLALAVPLLAAIGLAGCSGRNPDAFAPECPALRLLPDAADLTRFRGQGTDLTDVALQARIVAVPASCRSGGPNTVSATINVVAEAARGPAAQGKTADLPYLVSVMRGDRVLDQKQFHLVGDFPANVDRMTLKGEDIDLAFPVSPENPASEYTIYVSFRLTPAELAFNRKTRR
jgi:hypothetical protein